METGPEEEVAAAAVVRGAVAAAAASTAAASAGSTPTGSASAAAASAAAAVDVMVTADLSVPYVVQLARQLETFAGLADVSDLGTDDLADLLLVMANAAEHLETQTAQLAMTAHQRDIGRHIDSGTPSCSPGAHNVAPLQVRDVQRRDVSSAARNSGREERSDERRPPGSSRPVVA